MSNKVLITNSQKAIKVPSGLRILIRRACNAVLEYEHFDDPAEISVTFVDNAAIAELNNQYRNKPMPTDVLSFPLGENGVYDVDENNGCKMLGDIVISMERAQEQATLYGHLDELANKSLEYMIWYLSLTDYQLSIASENFMQAIARYSRTGILQRFIIHSAPPRLWLNPLYTPLTARGW